MIRFPTDVSIGTLSLRQLGSREDWSEAAKAIGDIPIPSSKEVRLEIYSDVVFEPSIFLALEPNALSEFAWVSSRRVTNSAITHLRHLTGLRGLELWETNIGDDALRILGQLSNLCWLDIGDTQVTDDGLAYLRGLALIEELTLLNDSVSDKGIIHLRPLAKLKRLDLMGTSVTDVGAEMLAKMTGLSLLRIANTRITEKGYDRLMMQLPHCRIRYNHPQRPSSHS